MRVVSWSCSWVRGAALAENDSTAFCARERLPLKHIQDLYRIDTYIIGKWLYLDGCGILPIIGSG